MLTTDLWYTPNSILYCVKVFFGKYGYYDPCPINPNFDGLTCDWEENCFINPPYSRYLKRAFIRKAIYEFETAIACKKSPIYLWLVNFGNNQDNKALSERASAIVLPYRRICFIPGHPDLGEGKSPRYDSIFYLWGNPDWLKEAFSGAGEVYEKKEKQC